MPTFDTTICRELDHSALEILARTLDEDGAEDLCEGEIIEFEVEVTYDEGYFIPGRLSGPPEDCYPDDCSDPEITEVLRLEEDGSKTDIMNGLSSNELDELCRAAWDHQSEMLLICCDEGSFTKS